MLNTRTFIFAASLPLFISACNQTSESLTLPDLEPQYGTPQRDGGSLVIANESGYLYTLGYVSDDEADSHEVVLKRFSPAGQELWSYSVDSCIIQCFVEAVGASIDAAGNAYVSTYSGGADIDGYVRLDKVSPAGTVLWSQAGSSSMATSAKGETFASIDEGNNNPRLIKYASNGQRVVDVPIASHVSNLAVSSDGSVYTFGSEKLVKYSGTGKVLWQRVVPFVPQHPWDITVSGNSVYLSASSYTNDVERTRLYKYTGGGTLVWQRSVTPFGTTSITDLSADASGNVYLSGARHPDATDDDLFVRKYTPSGSVAWTYTPNLPGTREVARGVSAADSGRVYVVGSTDGRVNGQNFGGQDAFLLRLDTAGKKVWSR